MINLKVKQLFFNTKAVTSRVDKAAWRVLSKFGAFVRIAARHSIRKRKKISLPGAPPSSHTGLLRRHIYFSYEPQRKNVIIGPVVLGSGEAVVPPLLEEGGRVLGKDEAGKTIVKVYRGRPFMGPAFEDVIPKLSAMWANSVR